MNNKVQAKNRIGWIDIAKAIGILFVLINHAELGLGVVTFLGGMFYMPVFFVLSGYTYKDNQRETVKTFAVNKARRLLIPYFSFQIAIVGLFTVKNLISSQSFKTVLLPIIGAIYSRNSLYAKSSEVLVLVPDKNIDLMPVLNAPLWFLTGLFSTLVIYKIIMQLAKEDKKKESIYVSVCMLIGILLKYLCPILLPWSIDTAFLSVAFIHFGKIIKRENIVNRFSKNLGIILAIFAVFVATSYIDGSNISINMSIREFGHSVLLYLVVGTTGSLCVMFLSKEIEDYIKGVNNILELIGRHTIGILAFHLLVFGAVSVLIGLIGGTTELLEKVANIIIAVVILVPIDCFIQRYFPFVYGVTRRNK